MRRFRVFLALMAFVSINLLQAQTVQITGLVTSSEDGSPIPGVSIIVKGTTIGAATDIDGMYSISVPQSATTLVFSFVGMTPQEIEIAGRTVVNVVLTSDLVTLDEIVITGYSTRRKDINSSAVTVVGGETLKQLVPSTSIDNMLQGKAPGVEVTSRNGKPGQTASVKIRGALSLNVVGADRSQPLYVIDGIFVSEEHLNVLNPNDIESMTVLKDASAAAIYGSRGANGVVVITTKQGKKGEGTIEYTFRNGTASKIKDPFEMMNTEQFIQYYDAARTAQGASVLTDAQKTLYLSRDHNWQDDILTNATTASHAFSISGGSESSNYFLSAGYDKNEGIVQKLKGFERYSARFKLTTDVNKRLKVGVNASFANTHSDEIRDRNNVQNPIRAMYDYLPFDPVYRLDADNNFILDENGNKIFNTTTNGFAILEALENNIEFTQQNMFLASAFANLKIIEGLSYNSRYSANYRQFKRESYVKPGSILDQIVGSPSAPGSKIDNGNQQFSFSWLNELSYEKSIGLHSFNTSVFSEYSKGTLHSYSLGSRGYASSLLTTQDNSSEPTQATTTKSDYAMFSLAWLLDYDFDGKYLGSASFRRDGASRFGADTRYGNFWSASIGWNLAKEDFLADLSWLNDLKTTVSYGTLGSWNIPNYASQGYYSFGSYNAQTSAIIRTTVGNAGLTWETEKTSNFGVEVAALNKRVNFNVDYFIKTRTDFLFSNTLSYETGGYSQYINAGEMKSKGLELSINGDIFRTQNFRWNVGANATFMNYKIVELNEQEQLIVSSISMLKPGETPYSFYLVRYDGVDPVNGDAMYLDKDGNRTNVFSATNAVMIEGKSPLPKGFGGFNSYVMYKGFDLSADFSFKYGHYIYNYMASNMLSDGMNYTRNHRVDALDYWKAPGDDKLPRLRSNSNQTSTRFLQDGSYLRFRNVTLGYNIPSKWISKAGLSRGRVFLQGQNLFTWTKFEGDPEISIGSGETQLGVNQEFVPGLFALYSYPALRTFMFGIDLKF
jgi:TonB-linked SusC/RagA family outer membrane protein